MSGLANTRRVVARDGSGRRCDLSEPHGLRVLLFVQSAISVDLRIIEIDPTGPLLWIADRVRSLFVRKRDARKQEEKVVWELLTFLDGRRVLFDPMTLEEPKLVADSVLLIRDHLDADLERLSPKAAAIPALQSMRQSCLTYLTRVPDPSVAANHWPDAINDLRGGISDGIESLERSYGLSMPGGTGRAGRVVYVRPPHDLRNQ